MSWTDEEIDKLFQDRANDLSFEFKPEYWDEFSANLPVADKGGMGSDFDEVDQLYQLSANELTFEYKDAYWQEVQSMLPRRRRPDFLWFGMALLFLGALTTGQVVQHPAQSEEPVVLAWQESVTHDVIVNEPAYEQEDVSAPVVNASQETTGSTDRVYEPSHSQDRNVTGNRQPGTSKRMNIPVGLTPVQAIVEPAVPSDNGNDQGAQLVANDLTSNDSRDIVDPTVDLTVVHPLEPQSANEPDRSEIGVTHDNVDATNEAAGGDVDNLATRPLSSNDPTREIENLQDQMHFPDFNMPTSSTFYVEVNGGLSQSMITPSESLSYSAGVGAGVRFQKGRFSFTTGLNGIWSFHDDIVLNREAKVYGFGSEVYRYTLKYDHIYTLEGMFNVGYRFGRHQITAGVRPSYSIGSKVGVTLLEEEVETDRQTLYGHMEGLRRFGLKPMIGYSVDIRPNLTIGLNIGMQTMKSVNADFIQGDNNVLPIDGQLYIRKGINFRK